MTEITLAHTIFKNLITPITRNYEIVHDSNKTLFAIIHDDYDNVSSALIDKYKFIEDDAFIDESILYANHGILFKYNRQTESIGIFLNKSQNFIELFLKSILVEDVSYSYIGKVKDNIVMAKVYGNGIDDFIRYLTDQWYFDMVEVEPKDDHDDFKMKYIVTGIINMVITRSYKEKDTLMINFLLS